MPKSKRRAPAATQEIRDLNALRRALHARGNIVKGLANVRHRIATECVQSAAQYLASNPVYRGLCASNAFPKEYRQIKSRLALPAASEDIELLWTSGVLAGFKLELNEYIVLRDFFTKSFMIGAYDSASEALDNIDSKFGFSLWSINCRVATIQRKSGAADHKELLNAIIQSPGVNPIVAYISYLYSFSIEDGVSVADLRNEFRDSKGHVFDYIRYHLIPYDICMIEAPHRCIGLEENSPIIDRFENFVEMIQILFTRNCRSSAFDAAVECLKEIDDPRLHSIAFLRGLRERPYTCEHLYRARDAYAMGNYEQSRRLADHAVAETGGPMPCFEIISRSSDAAPTRRGAGVYNEVLEEFHAFAALSRNLDDIRKALHRLTITTRKLPIARTICALLDRKLDLIVRQTFSENELLAVLGAPLNDTAALSAIKSLGEEGYQALLAVLCKSSISALVHRLTASGEREAVRRILGSGLPAERANLYAAYGAYNAGELDLALTLYEQYEREAECLSPRAVAFHYAVLKERNEGDEVLDAFAEAYVANQKMYALFPINELAKVAISQASPDVYALSRSILLHAYSTHISEEYDGYISDAFEDVLDFFDTDSPFDLIARDVPHANLIYFLRHIATIDRLEDTTRFGSLDAIEAERMHNLQWLVVHDSDNRTVYTQEISNITKDQEVARLSAEFERSKIYVHEEGIRRTFESDIKPDFVRYRQLIRHPKSVSQSSDIQYTLRKLLKESSSDLYLVIPSTEADQMFDSLFTRAFNIIVKDPNHGFKTYLSTRILHGVIEGELRSSFVKERIIFATDVEGVGQFMELWSESLTGIASPTQRAIGESVATFSQKIVDAILDLKDKRVRVLDQGLPSGIFRFDVTTVAYDRIRESITPTTTYEEFLDRLMAGFWESMDVCLEGVKHELYGVFKRRVLAAFDQLEGAIASAETHGEVSDLTDAIARCKTAFLRDLERVASWFGRAGIQSKNPFFIETAVQVATLITNNCYPTNPLMPEFRQDRPQKIVGELLNPIVDLLTNCLQNAAEHSGFEGQAPISCVEVGRSSDGGIEVHVITELAASVDLAVCEAEISELLQERDNVNPAAVANERRSGIRKMKRIVKHDLRTDAELQIMVTGDRRVCVVFTIPRQFIDEYRLN